MVAGQFWAFASALPNQVTRPTGKCRVQTTQKRLIMQSRANSLTFHEGIPSNTS